MRYICRMCQRVYPLPASRATVPGYCSLRCQHTKARILGYTGGATNSEIQTLSMANQVGLLRLITEEQYETEQRRAQGVHRRRNRHHP